VKLFKLVFKIWFHIAGIMSIVIFMMFLVFLDLMMYTRLFIYMKYVFVLEFIITIIVSFFVVNKYFEIFGIDIGEKNKIKKYFKIYFGILWRAVLILIPIVGYIAMKYKGSIESRIWTIIIEILVGFPAIWWYLASNKKEISLLK
jgi:amino acid transporter